MDDTDSQLFEITDCGPSRIIRGRIERPRAHANSRDRLPHVILLHGFKGFMDWGFFPDISRRIARRGMIAVRFNMSGSGIGRDLETFSDLEAFAHNTYSRELEDLERVRAWIAQSAAAGAFTEIDASRAALLGHSRGGGIALLHAAEHPELRSVVTWAAIANVDRFDDATKAQWRAQGFVVIHNARTGDDLRLDLDVLDDVEANREGLDIVAACRRMRVPTLLIHGLADEAVPSGEPVTMLGLAKCSDDRPWENAQSVLVSSRLDAGTSLPVTDATVELVQWSSYDVTQQTGRGYLRQTD